MHYLDRAVIVAVITVRMVQVTVNQVVRVITVGNPIVSTTRPVAVLIIVVMAAMLGCAVVRVRRAHVDPVLVHMIIVRVMQVTVVEEIRVPVVADRGVATVGSMLMAVAVVHLMPSVFVMSHGS